MYRIFRIAILSLTLTAAACGGRGTGVNYDEEIYSPSFAHGFSLYRAGKHSSVLEVRNPWQGAEGVSTRLFISRNGEKAPEGFDGQSVTAPVERAVCLSSSYVAFMDALGETDAIKGVSGARYISNEAVRERHAAGAVRDVGYDTNINYELLASLRPDIVFIYGVGGENNAVTDKLRELGITVTYIADYLEDHPLGKAEWIIPFGELFGKRGLAEDIFTGISENYGRLAGAARDLGERPKVMLNAPYRDVWFVPGDRSYMVTLIGDAGGEYVCAGNDSSVSRPISGESAWMYLNGAGVWINPNQATTIAELVAENPKFSNVGSVLDRRVYNCTKRRTEGGGSDFWESGALYADRALEDVIRCLHPGWDAVNEGEMYYFERLK